MEKRTVKKKQSTAMTVLICAAVIVFCVCAVFLVSQLTDYRRQMSGSVQTTNIEEWQYNTSLMKQVADALEIKYQKSSAESLWEALSRVDPERFSEVLQLDLSGQQLTELPIIISKMTGLEYLDISSNQLTSLPEELTSRPALTINAARNILPESYGFAYQYSVYLLAVAEEEYRQLSQWNTLDMDALKAVANGSLWISAEMETGGTSFSPLHEGHTFEVYFGDDVDGKGHGIGYYIDETASTHNITLLHYGTVTGEFVIAGAGLENSNARFPFSLSLEGDIATPVDTALWEDCQPLIQNLTSAYGLTSIGEFTQPMLGLVTELSIHAGELTSLPPVMAQMNNLKTLDLSGSGIESLPDLSGMEQLDTLILKGCSLTEIPGNVDSAISLRSLDLSANSLTSLPETLNELKGLTTLNLGGNQFTQWPDIIQHLAHLERIDLSSNRISQIPFWIGSLENLSVVNLQDNVLQGLPQELGRLRLEQLNVSGNRLVELPEWIGEMQLEKLQAADNQIADLSHGIDAIAKARRWELSGNLLPEGYGNQRQIILDGQEGVTTEFYVDSQYNQQAILDTLIDNLILSDGSALFDHQQIAVYLKTGGQEVVAQDGTVAYTGPVEASIGVYGAESNPNATIPITIFFTASENTGTVTDNVAGSSASEIAASPELANSGVAVVTMELVSGQLSQGLDLVHINATKDALVEPGVFDLVAMQNASICIAVTQAELEYEWLFDGALSSVEYDLALNIEIGSAAGNMAESQGIEQIASLHFAHQGALPGEALISITARQFTVDGDYYLYTLNEQGKLQYVCPVLVRDGTAIFRLEGTGSFIIGGEFPDQTWFTFAAWFTSSLNGALLLLGVIILCMLIYGVIGLKEGRAYSMQIPEYKEYSKLYQRYRENEVVRMNTEQAAQVFSSGMEEDHPTPDQDEQVVWCSDDSLKYRPENGYVPTEDDDMEIEDL